MEETIMFVGLDVHKESISVVVAEDGRAGEVRYHGKIDNSGAALDRLIKRLSRPGCGLRFSYEAGPCGYGVYRHLVSRGQDCVVAAPSKLARKPGDRVKTDRRDAEALARQDRAGELVTVWVPDEAHEAMRDLVRARTNMVGDLRRARQRLGSFLLRHERAYRRKAWTKTHRRWLADQSFEHPAQQIVFEEMIQVIEEAQERRDRLTGQIEELVPSWSMAPVVAALQAMRGIALVTAATVIAELGDLRRFDSPRQLMGFLGLVSSEDSSGERRRQGSITKAGNSAARKAVIEAAWSYRHRARISAALQARRAQLPKPVRDIAWRAQIRLCARFRHLLRKGKLPQVAATAVAREMLGFIWAIGQEVTPQTTN
ncbi:MAG: IS110 family transposase [bacterium]|nr:IS110 family transposase [bacterium]